MDLVETLRKAICCQGKRCHVEVVKEREGGKYLTDLPCYALGPDVGDSLRAVLSAIEAAGYAVVPMKPTLEMVAAIPDGGDIYKIWAAMLAARPKVTGP